MSEVGVCACVCIRGGAPAEKENTTKKAKPHVELARSLARTQTHAFCARFV